MVTSGEVVQHYQQLREQALQILNENKALLADIQGVRARVEPQEAKAREELAAAYLTDLSTEAIACLERLTGFRGLTRRDPRKAQAREAAMLAKTVERTAADERYVRRQYLVGPQGELTRALIEARDMLGPWQEAVERFEKVDGFQELVEVGYDTPAFSEHFWDAAYWRHWAAGDRVCKELGMDDFGDDVLPAWRAAVEKRDPWVAEVQRIEARVKEVHELVWEHDQAVARIPRLPAIYFEGAIKVVAEFLATADFALLDEWVKKEPIENRPVRMGLRRAAGLKAKLDLLDELVQDGLAPTIKQLEARIAKYGRKVGKYSRSKYAYTSFEERVMDPKFAAKGAKLLERPKKLRRVVDRIDRYDGYDAFDLNNPQELWYTEFTGKRPPSQFPRHRAWYDRQTRVDVIHDQEVGQRQIADAVAGAAVSRDLDDVGYLS